MEEEAERAGTKREGREGRAGRAAPRVTGVRWQSVWLDAAGIN